MPATQRNRSYVRGRSEYPFVKTNGKTVAAKGKPPHEGARKAKAKDENRVFPPTDEGAAGDQDKKKGGAGS